MVLPTIMDRLATRIEAEMGLFFPPAKQRDLQRAVHGMAEAKGFGQDEACIHWLLSGQWDQEKVDLCAHYLTVGETYFFREPRAFDLVCDYARQKMGEAGGADTQLRIWSAGCCTGEEPYSIAMALRYKAPGLDPRRISILATDINRSHLQFARAGVYRQWSFRRTLTEIQKLNFSEIGKNRFRICQQIKNQVTFAELNLALPVYPSIANNTHTMDIIFCRNVLMYFSRYQVKNVIERFRQCLVDGGWLIVNPSEASAELFAGFSGIYYPDAIYFQKNSQPTTKPKLHVVPGLVQPMSTDSSSKGAIQHCVARIDHVPAIGIRAAARVQRTTKRKAARRGAADDVSSVDSDPGVVIRARALANEGDITAAMHCLEEATKTGPQTAELYHAKALIAMESGDWRDAIQSLKRLIYLEPNSILAHYLMGILQLEQNRRAEANRQFEAANELLDALQDDELVPGADGLSAAYLRESVRSYLGKGDVWH